MSYTHPYIITPLTLVQADPGCLRHLLLQLVQPVGQPLLQPLQLAGQLTKPLVLALSQHLHTRTLTRMLYIGLEIRSVVFLANRSFFEIESAIRSFQSANRSRRSF